MSAKEDARRKMNQVQKGYEWKKNVIILALTDAMHASSCFAYIETGSSQRRAQKLYLRDHKSLLAHDRRVGGTPLCTQSNTNLHRLRASYTRADTMHGNSRLSAAPQYFYTAASLPATAYPGKVSVHDVLLTAQV